MCSRQWRGVTAWNLGGAHVQPGLALFEWRTTITYINVKCFSTDCAFAFTVNILGGARAPEHPNEDRHWAFRWPITKGRCTFTVSRIRRFRSYSASYYVQIQLFIPGAVLLTKDSWRRRTFACSASLAAEHLQCLAYDVCAPRVLPQSGGYL